MVELLLYVILISTVAERAWFTSGVILSAAFCYSFGKLETSSVNFDKKGRLCNSIVNIEDVEMKMLSEDNLKAPFKHNILIVA